MNNQAADHQEIIALCIESKSILECLLNKYAYLTIHGKAFNNSVDNWRDLHEMLIQLHCIEHNPVVD